MHKPRYIVDEKWLQAWGIAWSAMRKDEVIWVMHSGALHGFRSNVCFDPNQRIGAIVLVNGVADAAVLAMDLAAIARDAVLAAPSALIRRDVCHTPMNRCSESTLRRKRVYSSASSGVTAN
jgi:hypothetical protein